LDEVAGVETTELDFTTARTTIPDVVFAATGTTVPEEEDCSAASMTVPEVVFEATDNTVPKFNSEAAGTTVSEVDFAAADSAVRSNLLRSDTVAETLEMTVVLAVCKVRQAWKTHPDLFANQQLLLVFAENPRQISQGLAGVVYLSLLNSLCL
jgi:hypothetical protein